MLLNGNAPFLVPLTMLHAILMGFRHVAGEERELWHTSVPLIHPNETLKLNTYWRLIFLVDLILKIVFRTLNWYKPSHFR